MVYVRIFTKTFLSLAGAALLAVAGLDWATDYAANFNHLGFMLSLAALAAVIAVGWAFVQTPAVTAEQKALRQFIQAVLVFAGAFVLNTWGDWVNFGKALVPVIVTTALTVIGTYFANKGNPEVIEPPHDQPMH